MNLNDAMVVVLKDILLCLLRRFKCVTTTNMLVFWSASPVCLAVSQTTMDEPGHTQGKDRATLEFKSSGYSVNNNLNYDTNLSLSVSV